jgi:SulP family sulfate permease
MLYAAIRDLFREFKSIILDNSLDPLPMRGEFQRYTKRKLNCDLRAAFNVALLAFPQGMAYAVIAGLPIKYGITCSAIAAIVAPLLMGSRHTVVGPTNATAFMVFSFFSAYSELPMLQIIPILVTLVGIFLVVGAYLRMADLIQYISRSVVVGYITGAAILIIANQIRHILGINFADLEMMDEAPRSFFGVLFETIFRIPDTQFAPLSLGLGTLACYFLLKRKLGNLPVFALTLVLMSAVGWVITRSGGQIATYTSFDPSSILPDLSGFTDSSVLSLIPKIAGLAMAIAFLAALENSVMAKTIASMTGDRTRLNQDMLGLGVANIATAFLSGMPASGSLTRSALNFSSGATTRLSSILAGALCLAGAFTLAPLIQFVPKASLAALVVAIAISLINPRQIRICLRATRSDAMVIVLTCAAALLVPLHMAIFIGVGASVALYLRKASRPQLVEYEFNEAGDLAEADEENSRRIPQISIVHVEGELFFGAAELFRTQIQRTCNDPSLRIIILRMRNARHLDATSVMALEELIRFLRTKERHLIISGATRDVYRVLKNAGLIEVLGRDNMFLNNPKNPNLSTRFALKRAQELMGSEKADVKIYYDPNQDSGT